MIVVARFSFPHEAHIAKASLDSAGIESYIVDEHTVNTQWLYSNAIGGVRLMVAEGHAEEAVQILNSDFSQSLDNGVVTDEAKDVCPNCGSPDLSAHTKGKRPAFLVFIILGFPLFFYRHGYKCNQCGEFSEKL
ncbi:putative signal transducing protein [Photobacterium sp. R1]